MSRQMFFGTRIEGECDQCGDPCRRRCMRCKQYVCQYHVCEFGHVREQEKEAAPTPDAAATTPATTCPACSNDVRNGRKPMRDCPACSAPDTRAAATTKGGT